MYSSKGVLNFLRKVSINVTKTQGSNPDVRKNKNERMINKIERNGNKIPMLFSDNT
jgi:hypothetical protein